MVISKSILPSHVLDLLPQRENQCLNNLFGSTIKRIVQGKAYKQTALNVSGMTYFKSWAKQQPQFQGFTRKDMDKFCRNVNTASSVFDKWQLISTNLADPRLTEIDARRFSINQFYEAKSMDWCLSYNEILRRKGNRVDDPDYTDEKFNDIFSYIVQSKILTDIRHQENLAARLGERLKMSMISYYKRRRQPNPY